MRIRTQSKLAGFFVLFVLSGGCEEEEIRVYTAPADPAPGVLEQRGSLTRGESGMHWVLPEGWREVEGAQGMRVATLVAGEEEAMEFAVTVFPGDAGGLVANVNRWREQVGLEAVSAGEVEGMVVPFSSNGLRGWTMRIGGEEVGDGGDFRQMIVDGELGVSPSPSPSLGGRGEMQTPGFAALRRGVEGEGNDLREVGVDQESGASPSPSPSLGGRGVMASAPSDTEQTMGMLAGVVEDPAGFTWFVRGTGPSEVVSVHEGDFVSFVHSFHVDGFGGHLREEGLSAGLRPAAKREELWWEVPEHWEVQAPMTAMVYAMFRVEGEAGTAMVTVTPLRGDGGGLLANVNMWRGQVGLAPVSDVGEVPVERVRAGNVEGMVVHVVGKSLDEAQRGSLTDVQRGSLTRGETGIVVAILPEGDRTWFFRLTGPAGVVDVEKRSLVRLVESVRFLDQE